MNFASPAGTVTAVLGPTNTGKTHYAIERMLARESGIIGLPLRLLAREVYDRIVGLRGAGAVSLITGEEKIAPPRARYHVCTVEAMPLGLPVDFVAVDEIQLCTDPDRGHVFTDRLLRARGRYETLLLGSDTMRGRIASLVPGVQHHGRSRFSSLSWTGPRKISRLRPRTAIVAFSVDQVYAIAELIRRQRGGAAVVMGALSPRTRNAQVALYQQGDVDYMIATDAIGMGLNMDVDHVAFAGTAKFDGRRHRALAPNELAQIAGRAGRYMKDGTFGTTGDAGLLLPETIEAIEAHRFRPAGRLMWRNHDLRFHSVAALLASLEIAPDDPDMARAPEAEDQAVLRALWEEAGIREIANRGDRVRLLWDTCQIPDFRKVSPSEHATLIGQIYRFLLTDAGCIPSDWLAGRISRLDRVHGDIDALSKRLAFIRTWTYVANRANWVEDAEHWRGETRAVEDRLSDALHEKLTQRFVDRRTSVLLRRLKQKERLVAEVNDKGEVAAEGHFLGRVTGFRFAPDETAEGDELKTLRTASLGAVAAELARRADKLYLSPDTEIDVTDQGGLMWGADAIGGLSRGDDPLSPKVGVFVDDMADAQVAEKVERRLRHWLGRRVNSLFEPMLAMRDDEAITGLARGVAFRLAENFGIVPRREISEDIRSLTQADRAALRRHGVRFGQHFIFMPALLKPAPTQLRLLLWSLAQGLEDFPDAPPPGHVTVPLGKGAPEGYYHMAGYRPAGQRAIRIDMLERLADMIRPMDARAGFEATPDMLSITGLGHEQFAELMTGLGYQVEKGERPKQPKPAPAEPAKPVQAGQAPVSDADEVGAEKAEACDAPTADTSSSGQMTSAPAAEPASAEVPAVAATPSEDRIAASAGDPVMAAVAPAMESEPPEDGAATTSADAGGDAESSPMSAASAPVGEVGSVEAPEVAEAPAADMAPEGEEAAPAGPDAEADALADKKAETETYYIFRTRPRNRGQRRGAPRHAAGDEAGSGPRHGGKRKEARDGQEGDPRPAGKGKPRAGGKRPDRAEGDHARKGPKGKGPRRERPDEKPRKFEARPPRNEKPLDPDSPFAVLQQLKNR